MFHNHTLFEHTPRYDVTQTPHSGNFSSDSSPPSSFDDRPFSLAEILWVYLSPLILVTGLTGNILILVIMKRRKFRGTTTSVYLRMMAMADSAFLLTGKLNPFATCVIKNLNLLYYLYQGNIYSRFSNNSEANASELLENFEEILPHY